MVCVEAGLGVTEAIKMVGTESDRQGQLIGHELAMVSAELNSGTGLGYALRALAERTNIEDIKPLAATMIQSEQLGSRMGPALRALSDSLRNSTQDARGRNGAENHRQDFISADIFYFARDDDRDRRSRDDGDHSRDDAGRKVAPVEIE